MRATLPDNTPGRARAARSSGGAAGVSRRPEGALIALLVAVPGLASAQSSLQVSGLIDAGVRMDRGATGGSISSVGSGMRDANRITFNGTEDLGGSWTAGFVLQSGLAIDTGTGANNPPGVPAGGISFGRLAAISAGSESTGYLSLGRQYVPLWAISAGPANDPFGAGWLGGITSLYSFTVRASNSLAYTYGYTAQTTLQPAPRKGLGVFLLWSAPEASEPSPSQSGRQLGGNVSYGDGTWFVGYGYHNIKGSNTSISATAPVTDRPTLRQQTLAASYQLLDIGRLHVGVNRGRNGLAGAAALDRRAWHIAGIFPFGGGRQTVRFIYGKANDRTAVDADLSTFQIGYAYDLSKRTAIYTAVGQIDNNENAAAPLAFAVGSYARGSTPRSVILGIRHFF